MGGSGLTPPAIPAVPTAIEPAPSAIATPVAYNSRPSDNGELSWSYDDPQPTSSGYGATRPPVQSYGMEQTKQTPPLMQQPARQQIDDKQRKLRLGCSNSPG